MVQLWNKEALRFKWYHIWFHISCLVHCLHGVCCLFHGWDVGTLGNTLSGCVTQDPRVGASEASAIHSTHPVTWLHAQVSPSVVHVGWYTNG